MKRWLAVGCGLLVTLAVLGGCNTFDHRSNDDIIIPPGVQVGPPPIAPQAFPAGKGGFPSFGGAGAAGRATQGPAAGSGGSGGGGWQLLDGGTPPPTPPATPRSDDGGADDAGL